MIPWTLVMRIGRIMSFQLDFSDVVQLIPVNYLKTLALKTPHSQKVLNMMG
jgi:hypothetical protein